MFDLDGTLVDTAPDLTNALNDVLTTRGYPPVGGESVRAKVAYGAKAMIEEGLRQTNARAEHLTEQSKEQMLADFLAHYEANIAVESVPFPGALAALDALQTAGATLAVCTNKREQLAVDLLQGLGIAGRFAAIAGRDSFPASKPDPRHLTETLAAAKGSVEKAVMVGDSEVDIRTATAANVPAIAVRFGYGANHELESLSPGALIDHFDALVPEVYRLLGVTAALEDDLPNG